MNVQLFYLPHPVQELVVLDPEESRHLIRVLRKSEGDAVYFTDGIGLHLQGRIKVADQKACQLIIEERHTIPKPLSSLHLLVAPTKSPDRIEWSLEKCTEMGVSEFTPLLTTRTERVRLKPGRLEKITISAMKQSGQYYLPKVCEPLDFEDAISEAASFEGQKFIAHCEEDAKKELSDSLLPGSAMILIGPEGDFSPAEIELAKSNGFVPVSLGPNRLRTETAALYACAAFNFVNSRV